MGEEMSFDEARRLSEVLSRGGIELDESHVAFCKRAFF
jgi:hypothetical protein